MKYLLFLDDSGQLHPNYPYSDTFTYGGILIKETDFHRVNQSYGDVIKQVQREKSLEGELKTTDMSNSTRTRLLKRLRKYPCTQVFICTKVSTLKRLNFQNKKDVVRYKNYMIRRLIDKLIKDNTIPNDCSKIEVHIDNQNVAHSALDSLEDYLSHYFNDEDFYLAHQAYKATSFQCSFAVFYKDSAHHSLIQAADLLANTHWQSLNGKPELVNFLKTGYCSLRLPDGLNY